MADGDPSEWERERDRERERERARERARVREGTAKRCVPLVSCDFSLLFSSPPL